MTSRSEDEALRRRAIVNLGEHAPDLARRALEVGIIEVEHDVLAWEGSYGTVHAHRVHLLLDDALHDDVERTPSVVDALTAAIAAAIAHVAGHALAELRIAPGTAGARRGRSPYRD